MWGRKKGREEKGKKKGGGGTWLLSVSKIPRGRERTQWKKNRKSSLSSQWERRKGCWKRSCGRTPEGCEKRQKKVEGLAGAISGLVRRYVGVAQRNEVW